MIKMYQSQKWTQHEKDVFSNYEVKASGGAEKNKGNWNGKQLGKINCFENQRLQKQNIQIHKRS